MGILSSLIAAVAKCGALELQNQYSNYKTTLQQLAQKIGDLEQESEEHKSDNLYSGRKVVY